MSLSDDVEKAKRLLARVEPEKPVQWEISAWASDEQAPVGWEPFAVIHHPVPSLPIVWYRRPKPVTDEEE